MVDVLNFAEYWRPRCGSRTVTRSGTPELGARRFGTVPPPPWRSRVRGTVIEARHTVLVALASGGRDVAVTVGRSELRTRARAFSLAWADASSEHADAKSFWDEFFAIFGVRRRQVATFEALATRASTGRTGWIDLLVPAQMAVEHKTRGRSLDVAMQQLLDYLPSLPGAEHPWLLVCSDFAEFRWRNLDTGASGRFGLDELAEHVELFAWLAGYRVPHRGFDSEVAANLAATELLAELHDELAAAGYPESNLREWMTRILFCLFADDAGVWERGAFMSYLTLHTAPDGHDLGDVIDRVFRVLDTAEDDRPGSLDEDLAAFTYINGDLFSARLWPIGGTAQMRDALLRACAFDWAEISPAIFGSLFQNVMTPAERRNLGAHYTTEQNIRATLGPLLFDELEAQLVAANSMPKLQAFHDRLAELRVVDVAAGCGNFLVVAYAELRRLETECLREMARRRGRSGQRTLDLELLCRVRVDQLHGLELEEFPARIARTALYLADHLANREVSAEFGEHYVRFPIPAAPHVRIANALQVDWAELIDPHDGEVVIVSNPPFSGQKTRSADQTEDLRGVWGEDYTRWLDYVTGWYRRAADYITGTDVRVAFVSTNSITQGEQVARMWRPLLDGGLRIDFAYRTFEWTSEARGRAHVHVVIIGFSHRDAPPRQPLLFTPERGATFPPAPARVGRINPYLVDAPDVLVSSRSAPLAPDLTPVSYGNKPADGGHLVVAPDDLPPETDTAAWRYLRPYMGARELLWAEQRWCVWMERPDAAALRESRWLRDRVAAVRDYRAASSAADTTKMAAMPWRFFRVPQPSVPYVAIPRHVSENREWFTVERLSPDVVASDALFFAVDPDGLVFSVLSSAAFIAWLEAVGGRLKSDLRFSGPLVYNTFPLPALTASLRSRIIAAGEHLRKVRSGFAPAPLAELYDPLACPPELRAAHRELDLAVDRAFTARGRPQSRTARLELVFESYSTLANGTEELGRLRDCR